MTLREYLARQRQPEYCGINARAMLQHYGRTGAKRSWRFTCLHLSINARCPELKRDLFLMSRAQLGEKP